MFEMFHQPFMQTALAAITLTGLSCGYLSVYVVLKRLVFLTITLAQIASLAVVVAAVAHVDPMLTALVGVLVGGLAFSWPGIARYLPRENALGAVYALASAAGILLVAKHAMAEQRLMGLLYGDVLTVRPGEVWVMVAVVLLVGVVHLVFNKEFLLTSFDQEMAHTLGLRVRLWETLFFISLGLIIALAIRLAGVLLVFALLVIPGYAALLARCRVAGAALWATVLAALVGAAGLMLSYRLDLPTSATIISVLGGVVAFAAVIGRIRAYAAVPRAAQTAGHRARVALAWSSLTLGVVVAIGGIALLCVPRAVTPVSATVPSTAATAPVLPSVTATTTVPPEMPVTVPEVAVPSVPPVPVVKEPVVPDGVRDVPRPVAPPPPPPPPPAVTILPRGPARAATAALLLAMNRGETAKVRTLLNSDATLAKAQGAHGTTPLHWLANMASVEPDAAGDIAALLIDAGADVDARTEEGETPLITAAWASSNKGALAVATALIAHHADVNAADHDGNTARSSALAPDFCALLTDHGAR
jgi:ABC-type Mn2+/Zn2+ transport system permease subunit